MKGEYEIVRWVVRVEKGVNRSEYAYLVGFDKDGNEYTSEQKVYLNNEYHDVETGWICTDAPQGEVKE